MSAPAWHIAITSPSTSRPSAPRSAGTAVASTSTRGATTSLAPLDPGTRCERSHLGLTSSRISRHHRAYALRLGPREHAARYREAVGLGTGVAVAPGLGFGEVVAPWPARAAAARALSICSAIFAMSCAYVARSPLRSAACACV